VEQPLYEYHAPQRGKSDQTHRRDLTFLFLALSSPPAPVWPPRGFGSERGFRRRN
jgi:hypothetical protein